MRFAGFFRRQGNSRCGAQAKGRIREDERAARLVLSTEMHASENPDSAPLHSKRFQQRIRKWRNEGQRLISDDASAHPPGDGPGTAIPVVRLSDDVDDIAMVAHPASCSAAQPAL
jgi:hypothetical protein